MHSQRKVHLSISIGVIARTVPSGMTVSVLTSASWLAVRPYST